MDKKSEFTQRAISTLQRVADVNESPSHGPGIGPEHFVPLCKYHNRAIARKFIQLLKENYVKFEVRTTRMYVSLSVSQEDYAAASKLAKQFAESDPDTVPKSFSRDYDAAIAIGFVTVFCAGVASVTKLGLSGFAPFVVLINGITLAYVAERWNRNDRYQIGKHFSLADIMCLTALIAINVSIWRLAF